VIRTKIKFTQRYPVKTSYIKFRPYP